MVLRSALASSVIRVGRRCPELEPGEAEAVWPLRTDPGCKAAPPTPLSSLGQRVLGAAERDKIRRLVVFFFKITASFNGSNTIIGLRDHRRKDRWCFWKTDMEYKKGVE